MLKGNLEARKPEAAEFREDVRQTGRTEFLSNMSHEIRTPLNVIIGMCDIARYHIDDTEKVKECLEKISKAGDHLTDIVDSVLDITRMEEGKTLLQERKFSVEELSDEVMLLLEPLAEEKSLILSFSTKDIVNRVVSGDYSHVLQVILNLATNAIKYTPQGGFVKLRAEEAKNPKMDMTTYRFICEDNGIGMSEEFLRHIFEPFVRADDIRVNRIQGAGLGMSIVRKVVDMLGGSIDIKSAPGRGTVVTADFDFRKAVGEKTLEDVDEFKRRRAQILRERKIVLMAEDMKDNSEVITTYLEDLGFEVDAAENGEDLVDMFMESEEGFYKAVFMDIEMPVMDGCQATIMIRGLNRKDSDIPIIAMTANVFKDDRDRAMMAGVNEYLVKPIKLEQLRETVESLIRE